MSFHIVASTGRTATTFLSAALNSLPEVAGCHEGYIAANKSDVPVLPLINLENRTAFKSVEASCEVVAQKRSLATVRHAIAASKKPMLVDVAYYNATLCAGILREFPDARMVGIVRKCEAFVRSATAMEGEDLLPVGWPNPHKELSDREKFIGFGRIRPERGQKDYADWKSWSAIRRNIWLWQETNACLIRAQKEFGDRVRILRFEDLKAKPEAFWTAILDSFGVENRMTLAESQNRDSRNIKPSGYEIGSAAEWNSYEKSALEAATNAVFDVAVFHDLA